jgi:hypothetical protein
MSSQASTVTRLTREELYERVWAEPMQTLAPQFGISDVALKKTCTRMRVPTPGRGYWAKKNARVAVRRTPLPKLPASVPASMLTATFGRPPKPAFDSDEVAAQATGPVADQMRYEAEPEHRIAVADVLTDPHPLIAAVQRMTRKWGSCSAAGTVTFAVALLAEPAEFRTYVIVHELLHLRVPNHGRLFRSFLGAYVSGYQRYWDEDDHRSDKRRSC